MTLEKKKYKSNIRFKHRCHFNNSFDIHVLQILSCVYNIIYTFYNEIFKNI